MKIKGVRFGFGSVVSLVIAYFIYLYSSSKGFTTIAFLAKAYLIVYLGIAMFIIILMAFAIFILGRGPRKMKRGGYAKSGQKEKGKEYVDVEYKIKE